ncbi:MAG: hypothetical protein ACRDFS_10580, partial [Chloroflexota bacterium]
MRSIVQGLPARFTPSANTAFDVIGGFSTTIRRFPIYRGALDVLPACGALRPHPQTCPASIPAGAQARVLRSFVVAMS